MRYTFSNSVIIPAMLGFIALLICLSCSGNGNPTAPDSNPANNPGIASSENGAVHSRVLWGMYEIAIDGVTGNCEIVPLRGAMFNCNVVKFLQPPSAPIHLLTLNFNPGSDFTTGHLDLDITLQHPFIGLNKFRGFDVRGIVMGDGSIPFHFDPSALRAGPDDLTLENPDGFTRWWNPTEFTSYDTILGYTQGAKAPSTFTATAIVNPYKYFADDLDSDSPLTDIDLDNRGTFSVDPGINTRRYILQFPAGSTGNPIYHFSYAIDASWALPSDEFTPDYPPEAFPPEANTQEAWRVTLDDEGTTAWYINEDANGGSLQLAVEIFDWQGAFQPSGVAGEVAAIHLDCPLLSTPVDLTALAIPEPAGPGSSVWSAEISDIILNDAGTFECWVAVEADNPANYAPQIDGDPALFDWPDMPLTAYALGSIEISPFFPSDAPIVLSVIPDQGFQSTVLTDVQILGENFQDGATLDFDFDPVTNLAVTNVQWLSESTITCDLDCAGPLGFYDITVRNPDTQEGSLEDGFEVIEQPQESIWWQSHMYNNRNIGRNPTVPGADPETLTEQWSSPVGGAKKYCTPVVADEKIYFTGNDTFWANASQTIHCFDIYTGIELWSHPINPTNPNDHRAFACPVWWESTDGIDRIAVGGDQVYCYNADTGEELWTFDDSPDDVNQDWVSNQMQKYNGMVLARSRYGHLYALDFITGGLVSHVVCSQASEGGCGAKDGLVYISSSHYVDCADIFTGDILWSTLLPHDATITHWINPSIMEDRLYVSTYKGYVFAIAIEGNSAYLPGEIIWEWYDPDEPLDSYPLVGGTSVFDNKIFVAAAFNSNYVYCIEDLGDHAATFWKSSTSGYFDASPVWSSAVNYPDGVVYCPDRNGYIRAYDASDGTQVWAYDTGGEFRAGVSPILDLLVVTSGTDVSVFKGS